MKIQGKLYSIVAVLGVIAIGVALLGIRLMQGYNEQVDAFQLASQRAYDGEHLNRLITAVVMDSRGIYAAKSTDASKPFAEGIAKNLKAIDELLGDWSSRVPDDRKSAFDAVVAKAKEFQTFRTETARLGVEESPAAANEQGNNDANRNNRKQLQADVDKLVELDRQDLDAVRASIEEYYVAGRRTLIIFAVIGILAGIGIASWIGTAKIAGPLKRVNGALSHLTQGKMDVSIPAKVGRDEIGVLWSTVGTFRDTLVETERLKAAQANVEEQRRAEQKALLDRLAREFETEVGEVLATVSLTAQSTLKAAEVMVADAEETSGRSMAVASASEQTSANVQAVAGASEELSSSIAEIGRQISEASTLIGAAVEQARLTDHDVRSLADSASKVGTIVAMIQAIAEQTNLLALNATIEAARGRRGRARFCRRRLRSEGVGQPDRQGDAGHRGPDGHHPERHPAVGGKDRRHLPPYRRPRPYHLVDLGCRPRSRTRRPARLPATSPRRPWVPPRWRRPSSVSAPTRREERRRLARSPRPHVASRQAVGSSGTEGGGLRRHHPRRLTRNSTGADIPGHPLGPKSLQLFGRMPLA